MRFRILVPSLLIALAPLVVTQSVLPGEDRQPATAVVQFERAGERSTLWPGGGTGLTSRGAVWPQSQVVSRIDLVSAALTPAPSPTRSPAPAPTASPTPSPTPAQVAANDPRVLDRLQGFAVPIKGAHLSSWDNDLPGAPGPVPGGHAPGE